MFKGIKNNSVWNHKKVLTKYTKPNMMSLFETLSSIKNSKNKLSQIFNTFSWSFSRLSFLNRSLKCVLHYKQYGEKRFWWMLEPADS